MYSGTTTRPGGRPALLRQQPYESASTETGRDVSMSGTSEGTAGSLGGINRKRKASDES